MWIEFRKVDRKVLREGQGTSLAMITVCYQLIRNENCWTTHCCLSRRVRMTENVAAEGRLVWKHEGKKTLGRTGRRWELIIMFKFSVREVTYYNKQIRDNDLNIWTSTEPQIRHKVSISRSRVVTPRFKFRLETDHPQWHSRGFPRFLLWMQQYCPKFGHDRFLPPLQFTVYESPYHLTLYTVRCWHRH
jgi:hypothetical protein